MSNKRKTLDVVEILWTVNHFLATSPDEMVAQREAQASLLDFILSRSGTYSGYGFLQCTNPGTPEMNLGDETRRFYYISPALKVGYRKYETMKDAESISDWDWRKKK